MTSKVDVALATFNGSLWLHEQLASLAAQTVSARVVAGDDGSSDGTLEILDSWRSRMPGGLVILPQAGRRLGVKENFSRILAACDGDFVACCDQDDSWRDDHLEILMGAFDGSGTPQLAVGDLRVCSDDLTPMHPSFRRMQRYDARRGARLRTLVLMNIFPGCAMAANRALLRIALPMPAEAVIHDWWLALCAAALGRLRVLDDVVGDYRIHEGNLIGAERFSIFATMFRLLRGGSRPGSDLAAAGAQCGALLQRHRAEMDPRSEQIVDAAWRMGRSAWLRRRLLIIRHGMGRHPWIRQANLLLRG